MVSSVPLKTNVFYWKLKWSWVPASTTELSLVLTEYSREEERRHDQIHEGFFTHLDGMKAKIKRNGGWRSSLPKTVHT